LKTQKPNWEEEFEHERVAYTRLEPVQGVYVPRYIGCVWNGNRPAHVLSDIGGHSLSTPAGAVLAPEDFDRLMLETFNALGSCLVLHDDLKMDNYHLVGNKIMAVDMEMTGTHWEEVPVKPIEMLVKYLGERYRDHIDGLECMGTRLPTIHLQNAEHIFPAR